MEYDDRQEVGSIFFLLDLSNTVQFHEERRKLRTGTATRRIFMRRPVGLLFLFSVVVLFALSSDGAAQVSQELGNAQEALSNAMTEIGLSKGNPNLLLLTNAGYGQIGYQTTEGFLDVAQGVTGCSVGRRSLLAVHSSVQEPLWCALYRKDRGKMVFFKWTGKTFDRQTIDASLERILTPEGWKQASSGLIGQKLFSVVSISVTWAVDPPWTLLLSATFHDHFCPGVNSGYIAGQYLLEKLPPGPGDQYVFVTAPGLCPADALQVMFNATAGKSSGYTMAMSGESLAKYAKGGVQPSIVAMRVNKKSDNCEGKVLGFDWNKAYADTGVKADEISPQGGQANPMFWVARAKMSRELASLPKEKLIGYIVELKQFSGKAGLAAKVAGGDPYAQVWNH
jgi:formylmethanofuran dehydrogenase subunit E-like metal-binding protein